MPTQEEIDKVFHAILERQINVVKEVVVEDDIQDDEDVETLLLQTIKDQIKMSLDNLTSLYNDFIAPEDCTLKTALEFVPLFTVNGLINGAQLGIKQEEYYLIVDYYLQKYDLIAK